MTLTNCSHLVRLAAALGQQNVILHPPLILMDTISSVDGFTNMPQQQLQSEMPSDVYANYAVVLLWWVSFSELSLPPISLCCFLLLCLLSAFRSDVATIFTSWDLAVWVCTNQSFKIYPWQAYVPFIVGHWPMPGVHLVGVPSTDLSRGYLRLFKQLSSSHSISMVEHIAEGVWQRVTQSICLPYMLGRNLPF